MLSDKWIQNNYIKGEKIEVFDKPKVYYCYWKDQNKNNVGVTLSFGYAHDTHYEFEIDAWDKMCVSILKIKSDKLSDDKIVDELRNFLVEYGFLKLDELLKAWSIPFNCNI